MPNFKWRLSGVTATIVRLVPIQSRMIKLATVGAGLPDQFPHLSLSSLLALPRTRPGGGARVWHARRNTEMIGGLALKWLLRKRLKLVFTSASQRTHSWLTRFLIDQMDDVIATSDQTAGYLERPAHVILHGIDTERFRPVTALEKRALRTSLGLPEQGVFIGCYGRIRAQKGTDVFVDAMRQIVAERADVKALVMGRATEKHIGFERELKAGVDQAGLAERILFLAEAPIGEMAAWYQVLDLFVAPQRWEGFGLTPLEAMACGVPTIATTVGAFPELVREGETGRLIPPGDASVIVAAVREMLHQQELDRSGRAARALATGEFQIQQEAKAIVAVYRALMAEA